MCNSSLFVYLLCFHGYHQCSFDLFIFDKLSHQICYPIVAVMSAVSGLQGEITGFGTGSSPVISIYFHTSVSFLLLNVLMEAWEFVV